MPKNDIHLVKAAFHSQFKTAMESCGISAAYYFKKVKLPTEVSDPESLLPEKPFWQLINMVAKQEKLSDFGSRVAQVLPWHKIESLAPLIQSSQSLEELLTTFCKVASSQSSNTHFTLKDDDTNIWFHYTANPFFDKDMQMELYRLTSMIQLVQLATGKKWRPEDIHLLMRKNNTVKTCPLFADSSLLFSQTYSAFTIQRNLLQLPVNLELAERLKASSNYHPDISIEFTDSIRQIINVYTLTGTVSIEEVSSIIDMSVRTLQRRLTDNGLKFNELLKEKKFEHAKEKLQDDQIPIAEIAKSLGYSDAAHFTRAFHRWSGVSPTDYKKRLAENSHI